MDNTTVFSKTGKGLLEVKNRSNRISKEQYRVLSLIDGKANLDELADRARTNPTSLRQILTQLSEGGYVKVLVSSTASDPGLGAGAMTGSYYVDDLDFTAVLGPAGGKRPSIYQSTETEHRQRESAERKAAEAAAAKKREEEERRKQDEAVRQAREEARAQQVRAAAERAAKEEAQRVAKLEAELKSRLETERKTREAAAAKIRAESEARMKAELDRQIREAAQKKEAEEEAVRRKQAEERARQEAEARARREEEERKRKEEEARKRREEEERARQEAEARARREEEDRRRKEEEARKRREEEERVRQEAEARARREEEERKRKEEEARKRREEEERARQEAEARARREEEERQRKEEEARKRREEEERVRQEAEARARREEEERKRREEEARKRREEEERARQEAEARARREEEERQRKEEEEARKRREEEERIRQEAEARARREEEERQRKEEEARKRREEEERARQEAEARARREEEERRRKEEEARKRREQEEAARQAREAAEREQIEALAEQKRLEAEVQHRKAKKRGQHLPPKKDDFDGLDARHATTPEDDAWLLRQIGITTGGGPGDQAGTPPNRADVFAGLSGQSSTSASPAPAPQKDDMLVVSAQDLSVEAMLPSSQDAELPGMPEVEEIDGMAPASATPGVMESSLSVSLDALSPGVFEVDIAKALEEQERRVRMEEEARAAVERAEMEAQQRAEREAREISEAGERARREAAERAREESERLAREDKERRELEEEERRRQREVERRMREQQRQEAERRKREEDLSRQRKEQEEREQRKADRERVQREIRRSHVTPLRILAAAALIMVGLVGAIVQFASLSPWAPDIARVATLRIGEPVRIASVRAQLVPQVAIIMEGVTVGVSQDVQAKTVTLVPQVMSLMGEQKLLDEVHIKGVTMTADALKRAGAWGGGPGAKAELVSVPLVRVSDLTLDIPGVNLPSLKASIRLGQRGEVLNASVQTNDDHLHVDFLPRESDTEVLVKGRNFTLPVGPAIEIMDLQGKGAIVQGELRITGMEYFFLGGQGDADMVLRWREGWNMESNFSFHRLGLEPAMRAFGIDVLSDGSLDAKGIARMRSGSFNSLFEKPEVDASFTVLRGNLAGFDLPRALQQRSREGVQGGKTRFEELNGVLQSKDGRYQFRSVKLQAGILKATGQMDISPSAEVSGRIQSELRSTAGVVRGSFNISGNSQAILLKP